MEQPASSVLWIFPELARFLLAIDAVRIHGWMKCFGHPLPKPSVFMVNIIEDVMKPLERTWSKKLQEKWDKIQTNILLGIPGVRRMLLKKNQHLGKRLSFLGSVIQNLIYIYRLYI